MLRRSLLGIALLAGLGSAEPAQAQIGIGIGIGVGGYRGGGVGVYYGGYPRYYGYPGYYGGYYGRPYYDPYYYGSGVSVYVQPRPVYYAPAYVQPAQYRQVEPGPQPIYVNVQVPADALVWFDGNQTTQTGATRSFVSPPLPPGRSYSYEVAATYQNETKWEG